MQAKQHRIGDMLTFIKYLSLNTLSYACIIAVCILRFVYLIVGFGYEGGEEIGWIHLAMILLAGVVFSTYFIVKSKKAKRICSCIFTLVSFVISLSWIMLDSQMYLRLSTSTYRMYYATSFGFGYGGVVFVAVSCFVFVTTLLLAAIDERYEWKPEKNELTPEEACERLRRMKRLIEEGVITQEDYDAKSVEIVKYL